MVTYQFEIDDETWNDWKETVPRSKALDERLIELIEADTDGRVDEREREPASGDVTPTAPDPTPTVDADDELRAQLRDGLAGSGELLERRVDAVLTMYGVLRERGSAEKGELLNAVDVDATGYQDETSVWSNMVKGKDTLSALPGVETPPTGRTEWRWNP
jgi:hypothetical protein